MSDIAIKIEASAGNLRVWWVPQVPMHAFHIPVASIREAQLVLETLRRYDAFQFENRIKPDYANAGGLEQFDGAEWCEWCDPETGASIDDWLGA